MSRATKLTVQRMCQLAQLSRAGFYRRPNAWQPAEPERELGRQIHKLALQWPSYGSRRIRKELGRQGWRVNRKRVQRHMREQNLLCRPKRKFRVTTDSQHGRRSYAVPQSSTHTIAARYTKRPESVLARPRRGHTFIAHGFSRKPPKYEEPCKGDTTNACPARIGAG